MEMYRPVKIDGKWVTIKSEKVIETEEGQDEMCGVCKHPDYPNCMNRCIPYNEYKKNKEC